MDARAATRAWIEAWQSAWPANDVDRIAAAYADGDVYRSHPFRESETARSYLQREFGEEELVRAWFGDPVVEEDRAAVEYWAVLRTPGGREVTIAGASVLHFDAEGHVVAHRDYWDQSDGATEPPSGWGR